MTRFRTSLGYNNGANLDFFGLEIDRNTKGVFAHARDSMVSYEWVGEYKNLSTV